MVDKIDVVVPYVNNNDPLWQKIYIDYCKVHGLTNKIADMRCDRFEDIGLINYQLKLINKNMPFINKIYLLLMNKGQEPKDLPSNVEIVYHAKFIPQRFLPTFNSTTIEMFLWNIPNLSEYFIYANDDMLPLKPLKASDFFTDNGKCKIRFVNEDITQCSTVFRLQCYNSFKHIAYRLDKPSEKNKYDRPIHTMIPMVKSHCSQAYRLIKDIAEKHIMAFRTQYQYNQYIYPNFERFMYGTKDSNIDFFYSELDYGVDLDHQIVCINIINSKYKKELIERLNKICK